MKNNLEKVGLKLLGILYLIIVSACIFYHVTHEIYFQTFPGIFVGFIEMCLKGSISLDYLNIFPLFHSDVIINQDFATKIQGIMTTESYFPNFIFLFLILQNVTGLSPQLLTILPLGVFFIPIMYLALINEYVPLKNNSTLILRILLAVYILFYFATTKLYGSFYVGPPSFLLAFVIFYSIKKYSSVKKVHFFIIIVISILSLSLYWHSALMVCLFFIISLFIISAFVYLLRSKDSLAHSCYKDLYLTSKPIALISGIISLTFMHLWQSNYFASYIQDANIWDFISKVLSQFTGKVAFPVPYVFNYKDLFFGRLHFISLLLIYIFSLMIFTIPIFMIFRLKKGTYDWKPFIFSISLLFSQIIHVILYYKTDSLNFIYISFFFPLFGISLFAHTVNDDIKYRKILHDIMSLFLIILIGLSLICNTCLCLTNQAGQTPITKYDDTKPSFDWVYNNINVAKNLIVDFNILGIYVQRESYKPDIHLKYFDLDSYTYGVLVGDNKEIPMYLSKSYFVLDHKTMSYGLPINVLESRALLKPLQNEINNCTSQNKIYNDNSISIFLLN